MHYSFLSRKANYTVNFFFFEDGPELILEYFYIDKYVSVQLPWYLLVRDAIVAGITFLALVDVLNYAFTKYREETSEELSSSNKCYLLTNCLFTTIVPLLMALAMFIRVPAAAYQYVTGKVDRACFSVKHGSIIQTPFDRDCLRKVDWLIIFLFSGIPILILYFSVGFFYHRLAKRFGSKEEVKAPSFITVVVSNSPTETKETHRNERTIFEFMRF